MTTNDPKEQGFIARRAENLFTLISVPMPGEKPWTVATAADHLGATADEVAEVVEKSHGKHQMRLVGDGDRDSRTIEAVPHVELTNREYGLLVVLTPEDAKVDGWEILGNDEEWRSLAGRGLIEIGGGDPVVWGAADGGKPIRARLTDAGWVAIRSAEAEALKDQPSQSKGGMDTLDQALPQFMHHFIPATLKALKIASVTVDGPPPVKGDTSSGDTNPLAPEPAPKVTLTFEHDGHLRPPFEVPAGVDVTDAHEGDYLVLTASGDMIVWRGDFFERTYAKA